MIDYLLKLNIIKKGVCFQKLEMKIELEEQLNYF